jgi:serine/threonine protein kinase/tetratricopeptide (TPR) repeat protein
MIPELGDNVGPYRLVGFLGKGGMASVYLAEHRETSQKVALKSVLLPSEALLPRIRREIAALARIRHPGIVRVLDDGLHAGLPWYAMELIEGKTLRGHLRDLRGQPVGRGKAPAPPTITLGSTRPDQRAPAPDQVEATPDSPGGARQPRLPMQILLDVLGLVRRICGPLAYLHGMGLVHRDLKPENILLRPDFEPVLVDFGLVSEFGGDEVRREALESAGVAGTVAYMAPEQARGELVDARADLYSLGCILYELVAGRRPFVGKSHYSVLEQHLNVEPVPPSILVDGLPPGLDELILGLLAKEPRRRIGYATDVSVKLAALGAEDKTLYEKAAARDYLYRAGFAGRGEPLHWLEERVARLESGPGGVVLLSGESGVGKTRLVLELGRRLAERDVRVLTGECFGPSDSTQGSAGTLPLEALRKPLQAIADRCREWGRREAERLVGSRGTVLEAFEPALAGLPGLEKHPPLAELPPEAARLRLFDALAETFGALAKDCPVLLALDDLHWSDGLTLGFLRFLAEGTRLDRTRLLVVGTYRSEEETEELRVLARAPGVHSVHLGRLEEDAVGAMVADMLALPAPPALFVRFLTRHSEGNPFFVAEYLRTAVAEAVLYRNATGTWEVRAEEETATESTYEGLSLPRALQDLVRRRLDGLRRPALRLAEAAAVLGREMDAGVLLHIAGLKEAEFLDATGALLRRQVLEEMEAERFRFAHDKIREVAYAGIGKVRRRRLHASAAQAIEARHGTERYEHLAAVGRHWELAGEPLLAARYRAEAGERAATTYTARDGLVELDQAIPVLQRSDQSPKHQRALMQALDARSRLLDQLGRFADAEADARALVDLAKATGDDRRLGRALRQMGLSCYNLGEYDRALEAYEESRMVLDRVGDPEELCWTRSRIGWIHSSQGRYETAEAHFQQALAVPGLPKESPSRLYCMMQRAFSSYQRGQLASALGQYETLVARFEALGDTLNHALCQASIGLVCREMGDLDRALALLEASRDVFDRLQALQYYLLHSSNIGLLLADRGEFERASKVIAEARDAALRHGEVHMAAGLAVILSSCELARGRVAEALQLASGAAETFARLGDRSWLCTSLSWEAAAHAAAGNDASSTERFRRALAISEGLDTPLDTWKICLYWAHTRIESTGATKEGRDLAEKALHAAAKTQTPAHGLLAGLLLDLHDEKWEQYWAKLAELQTASFPSLMLQRSILAGAEVALQTAQPEHAEKLLRLHHEIAYPEHRLHAAWASRIEATLARQPTKANRSRAGLRQDVSS